MNIGKVLRSALSRERTFEFATVMHRKSGVLGPTRQGSFAKRTATKRDPTVPIFTFVITLLECNCMSHCTVGVHIAVAWLFYRIMLLGNRTEAVFTFCFVKRPLGFAILVSRNNSDACSLLSSLFPLPFPNPYKTCQARILTREWSKRSYWHSTRVLAWSGLVWSCSHISVPRLLALCTELSKRGAG
jgi:hypothetical protein